MYNDFPKIKWISGFCRWIIVEVVKNIESIKNKNNVNLKLVVMAAIIISKIKNPVDI